MSLNRRLRFIKDYLAFKRAGGKITGFHPIYHDYKEQAGVATGHYFHQDLHVASEIYKINPDRHIDIGSSIEGFVAHVAAFREIEVYDVRPLRDSGHSNIKFKKMDMSDPSAIESNVTDSISCLHAIEHFGLGRYGDPIDPNNHIQGFKNILKMLKPNGMLYISFPISKQNQVLFNAHRTFRPDDIFNWQSEVPLKLQKFSYVDDAGQFHHDQSVNFDFSKMSYGCGIYQFSKGSFHT